MLLVRYLTTLFMLMVLVVACSGDDDDDDSTQCPAGYVLSGSSCIPIGDDDDDDDSTPIVCEPGETRTCGCPGFGDNGVQDCRDDGSGWQSCDCPSDDDDDDTSVCDPGETRSCACPDGGTGAQECRNDASGWQTCECEDGDDDDDDTGSVAFSDDFEKSAPDTAKWEEVSGYAVDWTTTTSTKHGGSRSLHMTGSDLTDTVTEIASKTSLGLQSFEVGYWASFSTEGGSDAAWGNFYLSDSAREYGLSVQLKAGELWFYGASRLMTRSFSPSGWHHFQIRQDDGADSLEIRLDGSVVYSGPSTGISLDRVEFSVGAQYSTKARMYVDDLMITAY